MCVCVCGCSLTCLDCQIHRPQVGGDADGQQQVEDGRFDSWEKAEVKEKMSDDHRKDGDPSEEQLWRPESLKKPDSI